MGGGIPIWRSSVEIISSFGIYSFPWTTGIHTRGAIWRILRHYFAFILVSQWRFCEFALKHILTHSNVIISGVIGLKLIKFVNDVGTLYNLLKTASRSSNPLSNASANSEGGVWQCLRTTLKLIGYHSNVPWAITNGWQINNSRPHVYQFWKFDEDRYSRLTFWSDMPIFAVSSQKLQYLYVINSGVTAPNLTKFLNTV